MYFCLIFGKKHFVHSYRFNGYCPPDNPEVRMNHPLEYRMFVRFVLLQKQKKLPMQIQAVCFVFVVSSSESGGYNIDNEAR